MKKDLKWIEAVKKVLKEEQKPLHYSEIADRIVEKGYRKSVGKAPANAVNVVLNTDIQKKGESSELARVGVGTFDLRVNLPDVSNEVEKEKEGKDFTEGVEKHTDIIQAFGISWNRNQVLWTSSPHLLGVQAEGAAPVNFEKQIGVYLLHDGLEIIYIGQATEQSIGERIYQHTKDRLSGRWDRFSWFGLHSVDDKGTLESARTISIDDIGNTLEAILIESIEPRQNRKTDSKLSGLEYHQYEDPEIERKRAQKILDDLRNKL